MTPRRSDVVKLKTAQPSPAVLLLRFLESQGRRCVESRHPFYKFQFDRESSRLFVDQAKGRGKRDSFDRGTLSAFRTGRCHCRYRRARPGRTAGGGCPHTSSGGNGGRAGWGGCPCTSSGDDGGRAGWRGCPHTSSGDGGGGAGWGGCPHTSSGDDGGRCGHR